MFWCLTPRHLLLLPKRSVTSALHSTEYVHTTVHGEHPGKSTTRATLKSTRAKDWNTETTRIRYLALGHSPQDSSSAIPTPTHAQVEVNISLRPGGGGKANKLASFKIKTVKVTLQRRVELGSCFLLPFLLFILGTIAFGIR